MWVLLIGNPIEGFTITGPFGSPADATYYGDHHMDQNIEWWVMEVNAANWVPGEIEQPVNTDTKPRTVS